MRVRGYWRVAEIEGRIFTLIHIFSLFTPKNGVKICDRIKMIKKGTNTYFVKELEKLL